MQRDYLHVFVTGGVGATTHSSLLGIAVDLTLIAGFRGQRVIICFSFLFWTDRAATKAQTRNTVPVGPKQSRSIKQESLRAAITRLVPHVPLPGTVVPGRTPAEVTPVRVGASKLAGVLAGGALVNVQASATAELVVEAGGAEAAEAPQGVVTRCTPADLSVQTLVLIWSKENGGQGTNKRSFQ